MNLAKMDTTHTIDEARKLIGKMTILIDDTRKRGVQEIILSCGANVVALYPDGLSRGGLPPESIELDIAPAALRELLDRIDNLPEGALDSVTHDHRISGIDIGQYREEETLHFIIEVDHSRLNKSREYSWKHFAVLAPVICATSYSPTIFTRVFHLATPDVADLVGSGLCAALQIGLFSAPLWRGHGHAHPEQTAKLFLQFMTIGFAAILVSVALTLLSSFSLLTGDPAVQTANSLYVAGWGLLCFPSLNQAILTVISRVMFTPRQLN